MQNPAFADIVTELPVAVALAVVVAVNTAVDFEEESAVEEDSAITEMLGEHRPVGTLDPSLSGRTALPEGPLPGQSGRTGVESLGWESSQPMMWRLDPRLSARIGCGGEDFCRRGLCRKSQVA